MAAAVLDEGVDGEMADWGGCGRREGDELIAGGCFADARRAGDDDIGQGAHFDGQIGCK